MIEKIGMAITGGDNRAVLTMFGEQQMNVGQQEETGTTTRSRVRAMSLTDAAESAVGLSVGDIKVNPMDVGVRHRVRRWVPQPTEGGLILKKENPLARGSAEQRPDGREAEPDRLYEEMNAVEPDVQVDAEAS
eukprot:16442403-Heterocapsa_arctica.AAC.1